MKDFNIVIKQPNGTEIVPNTDMIGKDVLRTAISLEPKEQN